MEDNRKFIVLSLIALDVVLAEMLFRLFSTVVAFFRLSTTHFVGGLSWDVAGRVISYCIAIAVLIVIYRNPISFGFLNDVCNELRKVSWPEGKETVASTVLVVAMVLLSALILLVFDYMWGLIFRTVL